MSSHTEHRATCCTCQLPLRIRAGTDTSLWRQLCWYRRIWRTPRYMVNVVQRTFQQLQAHNTTSDASGNETVPALVRVASSSTAGKPPQRSDSTGGGSGGARSLSSPVASEPSRVLEDVTVDPAVFARLCLQSDLLHGSY